MKNLLTNQVAETATKISSVFVHATFWTNNSGPYILVIIDKMK